MVDEEAVPEALVEVPAPTGAAIEEAEFEEVAVGKVGEGAEVTNSLRYSSGRHKIAPLTA